MITRREARLPGSEKMKGSVGNLAGAAIQMD
jgi:hypothetical protein